MSSETAKKRSRGVRVLGLAFLAVFVLLIVGVLVASLTLRGVPAYYTQEQQRIAGLSDQERADISQSVRNHVVSEWTAQGSNVPGAPTGTGIEALIGQRRTFEIAFEDLNVWLASEGSDLLAGVGIQLPGSVKTAMLDAAGQGRLRITCDLDNGKVQQIVALTFNIEVDEQGIVSSTLETARAGKVPLPAETAIELIATRTGSDRMLDLMTGTPTGPIDLPIDHSGGLRDGRLVGLEVTDQAMIITRETVRRQPTK